MMIEAVVMLHPYLGFGVSDGTAVDAAGICALGGASVGRDVGADLGG